MAEDGLITCYKGGLVLKGGSLVQKDIWVRAGRVVEPQELFFRDRRAPSFYFDCSNHIVAPGFIDVQINGGFGVDFSKLRPGGVAEGVASVARGLLEHGVTAFCPTIITSGADYYASILPEMRVSEGGSHGAAVLGVHVEGPFISREKKGAHPEQFIQSLLSPGAVVRTYGCLDNVRVVTLAPELEGAQHTIRWLSRKKGVVVSLGHSMADLTTAEHAVNSGASLITHLFNAMLPFHHRDPGIVGLLTSQSVGDAPVYYSLIVDGNHTHETVQRIAHKAHPEGLEFGSLPVKTCVVLVTDAMAGMGVRSGDVRGGQEESRFSLGEGGRVEVSGGAVRLAGTSTLAGSVATMDECVRHFRRATACTEAVALEAASLHPARVLGLEDSRGQLEKGARADIVVLDRDLNVQGTFIAGHPVWSLPGSRMHREQQRFSNLHT
ncbi:N-acetylglucosamine-6-phosphate deacetylase [Geodia barretti]|uniref:N-acetylglucosamine-6-phosphate deacetylase n=2 Tax=Geodia barretti TaxID=519541 RepID=A0AA35WM78_GEOBA|nr:N-acetylglucosamine-6-phosphate deacetylase [Geodia barretti]